MRVHELAKELGTSSKELLAKLKDAGEFVKSASSTVESPVVTKMTEFFETSKLGKWSEEAIKKAKAGTKQETTAKSKSAAGDKKVAPKPGAAQSGAKKTDAKKTDKAKAASDKSSTKDDKDIAQTQDAAAASVQEDAAMQAGAAQDAETQDAEAADKASQKENKAAQSGASTTAKPGDFFEKKLKKTSQATAGQSPEVDSSDTTETSGQQAAQSESTLEETVKETKQGSAKPGTTPADAAEQKNAPAVKPGMKPVAKAAPKPGVKTSAKPGPGAAGRNAEKKHVGVPGPGSSGGGVPRPGNNPFATAQGMPRPGGGGGPRPRASRHGNNPSSVAETMGRNQSRDNNRGAERTDRRSNRGGSPGGYSQGGARGGSGFNTGPSFAGPPPSAGRGSRGGRGSTQGAFGRGGGRPARGRKSRRAKKQEFEQQSAPVIGGVQIPRGDGKTEIRIRSGASLADLAEKINVNPAALVTVLFHLGEMATATQSLDEDTFIALGNELGYTVKIVSPEDEDRELLESFDIDLEAEEVDDVNKLVPRSPVVTVMGHVDHGKTKLLDAIRHTDVIGKEHGGITQHIGAYQVTLKKADKGRKITFIDTPGHEAFTAMRARGAQVTDIAILVVAADDGVMPQTVEAINHAQSANVPVVVAVNKIDKPEANPDKIRAQLAEYGVVCEEYGGDVMFVDISAKSRTGIEQLLDAVLLTADAALELSANPDAPARGVAIEANLDKGRGAVTTVLVQRGTLRVGDSIVAGSAYGRVRAMFDDWGNEILEAGPSMPVQMLGLTSVPRAGDSFLVASDDRTARQIADKREAADRAALLARRRKRVSLENFDDALKAGQVDMLNLIIKGDVSGAVEALEDSLLKIDVSDEVGLRIIHRGVGAITQNDVNLATVDNAVIVAFNVRPAERVAEYADQEGVEIKYYSVIYQALEDIESALKGMLKPIYEEVELGTAQIQQVFRSSKFGNIAGCIVRKGTIKRAAKARLIRDGVVVAQNLEIQSLRREKDDVTEVREGFECGINLGFKDIQAEDRIETWELREKPRE